MPEVSALGHRGLISAFVWYSRNTFMVNLRSVLRTALRQAQGERIMKEFHVLMQERLVGEVIRECPSPTSTTQSRSLRGVQS